MPHDDLDVDLAVDEITQVLRLESGQADGVYEPFSIGPAGLRALSRLPNVTVADAVGPRIYYLALENGGIFAPHYEGAWADAGTIEALLAELFFGQARCGLFELAGDLADVALNLFDVFFCHSINSNL